MKTIGFIVLCIFSVVAFSDARFVEAPAECHVPFSNVNVDNEYKLQSCVGVIQSLANGAIASGYAEVKHTNMLRGMFIIDGKDPADAGTYPGGEVVTITSGGESGTDCTIIDANGTEFAAPNWSATTKVVRKANSSRVDVTYTLYCDRGLQVAE